MNVHPVTMATHSMEAVYHVLVSKWAARRLPVVTMIMANVLVNKTLLEESVTSVWRDTEIHRRVAPIVAVICWGQPHLFAMESQANVPVSQG